jgi:hypothetical protein
MSLVDGGIRRQAIQIAIAFDVVNPHAFGALDDNVERMIVVSAIKLFELDEVLGQQLIDNGHDNSLHLALSI